MGRRAKEGFPEEVNETSKNRVSPGEKKKKDESVVSKGNGICKDPGAG